MRELFLLPIGLRQANGYVALWHRHHRPVRGCVFCLAAMDGEQMIHGVAIVGRPVATACCDGRTYEVSRVATDGTPNVCSFLYGAARRAARALGYQRIQTYILAEESGCSLRAAGWHYDGPSSGRSWDRASRPRHEHFPVGVKQRWISD